MTFVDILKRFHMSTERDVGFGVPQGEIDSSDACVAFIDDIDAEIECCEFNFGRQLGIPWYPLGRYRKNAARNIRCIKHVDHTVLIATTAEDLQVPLDTL